MSFQASTRVPSALFIGSAIVCFWQISQLILLGLYGRHGTVYDWIGLTGSLTLFVSAFLLSFRVGPFVALIGSACLLIFYIPAVYETVREYLSPATSAHSFLDLIVAVGPGILAFICFLLAVWLLSKPAIATSAAI